MQASTTKMLLEALGVLAVRGPDARRFLHGQLSQDVVGQPQDRVALAGLHNPQGRVLALMRLVPVAPDAVLAVLPRELIAAVAAHLRRFVLRAKLTIADESERWSLFGLRGAGAREALAGLGLDWPDEPPVGGLARCGAALAWRHEDPGELRFVLLADRTAAPPAGTAADAPAGTRADEAAWVAADVAAGLPQVYAATSGAFVAQMLNLDLLGGISFDKGCYTGQEIIARAHYRGRVKRRMRRFETPRPLHLPRGARLQLEDGRSAVLVDSAPTASGGEQLLAVTGDAGQFDDGGAGDAARSPPASQATVACVALSLPYALPA